MANAVLYYHGIGENLMNGSDVYFNAYGNMLGQTMPNLGAISYTNLRMSGETSYDLRGFQPGHMVLGYVATLASNADTGEYKVNGYLQYKDGSYWYSTGDSFEARGTTSANQIRKWFRPIGIKSNNIRPSFGDTYRIYLTWKVGSYTGTDKVDNFTVSGLYIDDTVYPPGSITVSGTNLVYTDVFGAKHIVAYDGNYSGSRPGTDHSGFIRLDPRTARRLYYVDEYGYVRRTYEASNWLNYTSGQGRSVSSDYKGSIWTGNSSDASAQRYLCFVNNSGYMMRLMNGNPNGTE